MCAACDHWHTEVTVATPATWRVQVERLLTEVADGELETVEGPALDAAPATRPRKHVLQCAHCAQLFILEAGGCHVSGDRWRPLHGN